MAGIKIVDLPALGRDLISTDLLEVSLNGSGSRKITGQEIMNASKLAVGSTPIVSGTVGRLLFQNTGDVLGQSANLFWDNTNGRLGIGTSSPANSLDVNGTVRVGGASTFNSALTVSISNLPIINLFDTLNGHNWQFRSNGGTLWFIANSQNRVLFRDNGNVLIGTTTDAGFRLDVNGTARLGASTIQTLTVGLGAGSQSNNTVLGLSAFSSNISGNFNVAIGPSALFSNTTGTGNIGIGHFSAVQISNGTNNVAIGREALSNGNSSGNVVVGMQACNTITGNNNVVLGLQAQAGNFSNSIVIGNSAIGAGNNSVVLGNDSITTTVLKGNVGVGTSSPSAKLHISSAAGNSTSISTIAASNFSQRIQNTTDVAGTYSGLAFMNPFDIQGYIACNQVGTGFGAGGDLIFANRPLGGGTVITERMRIFANGNLGINTTTDAGFRLDVNGTARVQGALSSTANIIAGGALVSTGDVACGNKLYNNNFYVESSGATNIGSGQSVAPASAILCASSTTRGFLPPRMTNAQRAAIASPAVGLIVYCTDATEGLYVYKSTGWTFMV